MQNDYALVIGIDDYENKDLRPPDGAKVDATAIYEWLKDKDGGNVPAANCYVIISRNKPPGPLRDEIEKNLRFLIGQATVNPYENNRLYFYFSGHGLGVEFDSLNNALCLADWSRESSRSALLSRHYQDIFIRFSLFRQVFFLADCCRNTRFQANPLPPNYDPRDPWGPHETRRFIAYATQYRALTLEVMEEENIIRGIFTKVFLNGVKGAAVNGRGEVTAGSLKKYIKVHTPAAALKYGFNQEPDIMHNLDDDEPLFPPTTQFLSTLSVIIRMHPKRKGIVRLLDENATELKVFHTLGGDLYTVSLAKGTYILIDKDRRQTLFLEVNSSKPDEFLEFEF